MNEFLTTQHTECRRENDLIAYLYGEANELATTDFTRHLASCAKCAGEAAAFRVVRTDLAAWRESARQLAPSAALPFVEDVSNEMFPLRAPSRPKRSLRQAQEALVEFFRVSPRWLQASGAFAALVLCALAAFAFLDTGARPDDLSNTFQRAPIVDDKGISTATSSTIALTQNELDNLVEREVARRLDERRGVEIASAESAVTAAVVRDADAASRAAQRRVKVAETARMTPRRAAPAITNRSRRVPADESEDDELPRLSDLLYGTD